MMTSRTVARQMMFVLSLSLLSACKKIGSTNPEPLPDLYSVSLHGACGLIDKTGKLVVPLKFEKCSDAWEGVFTFYEGDKWGLADLSGKPISDTRFDSRIQFKPKHYYNRGMRWGRFSEGLAVATKPVADGSMKWGYIDRTGNFVITPRFDFANDFFEGYAFVRLGTTGQIIDKSGTVVLSLPGGDYYSAVRAGLALVKVSDKIGYMDLSGNLVINPQFDEAHSFEKGFAAVRLGTRWGFVDTKGKYAVVPQFDFVGNYSEGLAPVSVGNNWGYIDTNGKFVINPQYSGAGGFSEGLAAVMVGDKWGFITRDGSMAIQPQFEPPEEARMLLELKETAAYAGNLVRFRGGIAAVSVERRDAYVDKSGRFVWNPIEKATVVEVPQETADRQSRAALGAIRSALSIFIGDSGGRYPQRLEELTVGQKYLTQIPTIMTGHHPRSNAVVLACSEDALKDSGGLAYCSSRSSPNNGTVWVDCSHADLKGNLWRSY